MLKVKEKNWKTCEPFESVCYITCISKELNLHTVHNNEKFRKLSVNT